MWWPLLPSGTLFCKAARILWAVLRTGSSCRRNPLYSSLSTANMGSSTRCQLSSLRYKWGVKAATNAERVATTYPTWPIPTSINAWLTKTDPSSALSA